MSLNLYSLIIKVCEENNVDTNLEEIGRINNSINDLIERGVNLDWIKYNIDCLI